MNTIALIKVFFSGAITMAAIVIAMFFWRFRKQTGDRFFGYFALAFALLAVEHVYRYTLPENGGHSSIYLFRLAAFLVILYAIVDKNRAEPKGKV